MRALSTSLLMVLAYAGATPQIRAQALPASVIACADEPDATKRLSCYDHEVARLRTATSGTTASAPSASAVDSFGMTGELQRKEGGAPPPPTLDRLTAHITGVSYKPYGTAIVMLENGQVWEEAETGMHLPLRPGDVATIERGVLGAFYMSTAHVLGVRVKRVH
jgi:hypothetical protein